MFLGHYGVALAAKRAAPTTSLGTLSLAAQLLDVLWPIFLLLGLERVRIVPGLMPANSLDFVHYPFTHSLLAAFGWALLAGVAYRIVRRGETGAWVVGLAVLSHWLLDAPMHRPDLPLWPGSSVMIGGGLWNSVPLTLAVDGGLFLAGLALYARQTRAVDTVGRWGLRAMAAVLVLFFVSSLFGPPPASERALALGGLGLWLFVPWSAWVDRHRRTVAGGEAASAAAAGSQADAVHVN